MKSTIENIVQEINEKIPRQLECKTGNLCPSQIHTIAFPVQIQDDDSEGAIPVIIDIDGECQSVFSDDDFAFGLYHRLLSKSYTKVKGFGDKDIDLENDEMLIVVWGFSNQLGMNSLDFERKIIVPSIPNKASLVSSDFDSYRVSNNEFRNINYLNKPEEFIFSVKYRVQFKIDRSCELETNCV